MFTSKVRVWLTGVIAGLFAAVVILTHGVGAPLPTDRDRVSVTGIEAAQAGSAVNPQVTAFLKTAEASHTTWTGPTSSPKIAKNITVGVLPCSMSLEGCARQAQGVVAAAKALGWKTIVIDGQLNTNTQQNAMESFINQHVNAIAIESIPASTLCQQIKAARDASIVTISGYASDPRSCGGLGAVIVPQEQVGAYCAAFVIANGGGNAAQVGSNGNPQILARSHGFVGYIDKYGAGSTKVVETQYIPFSSIGPPEQPIMNAILARHPQGQLNWIFAGFDAMIRPLIAAAGSQSRNELKGCSSDGDLATLDDIRQGNVQAATVGFPLVWTGWGMVDELNRSLNHVPLFPLDKVEGTTAKLLTKDNLPPAGQSYDADVDYRSHYKSIWGVK
ncbi:MAG: substrate-binding domain-containing protein [Candidatus Velthaea sp.]